MLITTSPAGQLSPAAFVRVTTTCRFGLLLDDALGDGLGDGLVTDGLGEAIEVEGKAPVVGILLGVPGLFKDVVEAVGWVAAPPTAQASKASTASPPASAKTLRRQYTSGSADRLRLRSIRKVCRVCATYSRRPAGGHPIQLGWPE